ncbi:hypothetical protein ElyMa_000100300 [Elysia marginata]|uniref:Carboxylesterase type B domain-containing protein n=1 Tax=Elysia marginata TaxID=1093978 RepID=A0AAV4ELH5_9GAST|nr:hypothetical protein ElyMa_000100300 [Elysia marginata]
MLQGIPTGPSLERPGLKGLPANWPHLSSLLTGDPRTGIVFQPRLGPVSYRQRFDQQDSSLITGPAIVDHGTLLPEHTRNTRRIDRKTRVFTFSFFIAVAPAYQHQSAHLRYSLCSTK